MDNRDSIVRKIDKCSNKYECEHRRNVTESDQETMQGTREPESQRLFRVLAATTASQNCLVVNENGVAIIAENRQKENA